MIAALRAFDGPIVLIAGGRDKGVDLTDLAAVVGRRAAAAVLIGESGPTLEGLFRDAGLARTERAPTMDEAVAADAADARPRARSPPIGTGEPACRDGAAEPGRARASTCSRTTRPAVARSRPPWPRLADAAA